MHQYAMKTPPEMRVLLLQKYQLPFITLYLQSNDELVLMYYN